MTERYARQSVLAEVGEDGQLALGQSRVLIVGLGGLGSPAALYLAAAGIGHLGLVDGDTVSVSNLQRQILFETKDAGRLKVDAGKDRLLALNPNISIATYPTYLDADNAEDIGREYDVLIDGSDNFATKELVNALACRLQKPLVYGSVLRFEGRVGVFWPGKSACYRCLFPEPPTQVIPNCAEAGVIGALVGSIGSLQALEAIKICLISRAQKSMDTLLGKIFVMGPSGSKTLRMERDPDCPVCSLAPHAIKLPKVTMACAGDDLSISDFLKLTNDVCLLDVREELEWARGIIPLAKTFALSQLMKDEWPDIPADAPLVLYCQSGVRSRQALGLLRKKGWRNIRHLDGGFQAWSAHHPS